MASLRVHPDRLVVALTPAEKVLGLKTADIEVPREAIRSAVITDDPWIWIRGIRTRGTSVPLVVALGVWKYHGGQDFISVKAKRRSVVLELDGFEYARLIISTNKATELIESLAIGETTVTESTVTESTVTESTVTESTDAKAADAESTQTESND